MQSTMVSILMQSELEISQMENFYTISSAIIRN